MSLFVFAACTDDLTDDYVGGIIPEGGGTITGGGGV